MYPETDTFWMEPSGLSARGLRRYVGCEGTQRCGDHSYHDAMVWVDRVPTRIKTDLDGTIVREDLDQFDPADDRWPMHCTACGFEFRDIDPKQTVDREIYRRKDTGELFTLSGYLTAPPDAPAAPGGAMWDAYWLPDFWKGPDGIALQVVLPNGRVWSVDSAASNCTRPGEPHQCWVRHGDPQTGQVTVDKDGETCAAGAGSILAGDYHGFLRAGHLTEA